MDSCITIRTIVFRKGRAYVQAGAGIVWDSVPEKEYEETLNKAKAMLKAIRMAEAMFPVEIKEKQVINQIRITCTNIPLNQRTGQKSRAENAP
ncbi:Anthranilate synthase component 1 [compost metagenome]